MRRGRDRRREAADRADAIAASPGTTRAATTRSQRRPQRSIRRGTRFRSPGTRSRSKASSRTRSTSSCSRYDLIVLDHPHLGDAVAAGCLQPLEDLFEPTMHRRAWQRRPIGPCLSSYRYAGRHWALPLDAATQVHGAARRTCCEATRRPRPGTRSSRSPTASGRSRCRSPGRTRCSPSSRSAVALGEPPAERDPELLVSTRLGGASMRSWPSSRRSARDRVRGKNPIGMLEPHGAATTTSPLPARLRLRELRAPGSGRPLRFGDAPRAIAGGRPGSTLGGTGIGISTALRGRRRSCCAICAGCLSEQAQTRIHPRARRPAEPARGLGGRGRQRALGRLLPRHAADTIEAAWVRPRHSGYIAFQGKASALLREAFEQGRPAAAVRRTTCNRSITPAAAMAARDRNRHERGRAVRDRRPDRRRSRSIARQKLNAVTPEMSDALVAAVEGVQRRATTIRCVIVDGRRRAGVLRRLRHPRARHLRDAVGVPQPRRLLRRDPRAAASRRSPPSTATPSAAGSRRRCRATSASLPTMRQFAAPEIKLGWIGGGGMAMHPRPLDRAVQRGR